MPTIDATVAGASSNSYATTADADTYFDERLQSSSWTSEADADVKERALIMATRRLDQLRYEGDKSDSDQALKWPRIDAFDDNDDEYASDEIPTVIEHATYEVALWLLNENADSSDPLAPTGLEGFERVKVGPLDVTPREEHTPGNLPDSVLRMLRPVRKSAGLMATLERG